MFPRRADDSLRVLVHLGIVVLFLSIFLLRFDETTANRNRVQFVCADTAIQNFLTALLGIEVPLPFCFTIGIGKGKLSFPIVRTARFGFLASVAIEFFSFAFAANAAARFLSSTGSWEADKVCALWSEDLFQDRHVERRRRLNKAVGRLLRRIEFFLFYLLRRGRSCLGRQR